ncbi:NnrS family protein [Teredinibacter franksiae]|uniref:NnrS family protein n=1 Tax=Teredinibacter franksiae TaxID=2761453 RepID=UPI0016261836|nr:NnrS family protein [Teredinibacter franksiae]
MTPPALLAYAFRPFFLLVGLYGALSVFFWAGFLLAGWQLPTGLSIIQWHSHEMLYGMIPAAIAGFLLTAITNWTSAPPLKGFKLLTLVLLWLSGRILFAVSGSLSVPYGLVAAVDISFLLVLGISITITLVQHRNYRNLILVAIIALLITGNSLVHIGIGGYDFELVQKGLNLGFNVITLMIIIIAGRITPAFSINWLKQQNRNFDAVQTVKILDITCIGSLVILIIVNLFFNELWLVTVLIFAGAANLIRLLLWAGWKVKSEPLLWVLHLGYFWIVTALFIRGFGILFESVPDSLWQHTLGVGAMGTLIFGVMTRVAVGHTGRKIKLVRFGVFIYIGIALSTILRMAVAVKWLPFQPGILLTSLCWVAACVLFLILYWPILSKPRIDGRPG